MLLPTRVCARCRTEKPLDEFPIKNRARGTRASHCPPCRSDYGKAHYRQTRRVPSPPLSREQADHLRRAIAQVRGRREQNRSEILRYLRAHPCVDCGRADPVVLESDHRDPALKIKEVANRMVSRRWQRVLAEIEKCDVRCANCHRRRTAVQLRWSKARLRDKL